MRHDGGRKVPFFAIVSEDLYAMYELYQLERLFFACEVSSFRRQARSQLKAFGPVGRHLFAAESRKEEDDAEHRSRRCRRIQLTGLINQRSDVLRTTGRSVRSRSLSLSPAEFAGEKFHPPRDGDT